MEKAPFAILFFGMLAMATGIVHVQLHTVWEGFSQTLVTLLGWGLLIKGFICITFPNIADRGGDFALNAKIVPAAGGIALLIGVYLSWIAYFA